MLVKGNTNCHLISGGINPGSAVMSLALVRFRFLSSGDFISDISVKVDIKIRLNKLKLKIIQRLCLCYIKVVADDLSFFYG